VTIEYVRAPAKLTTRLRIVGVRDDGYHLIDAEMITLDLFDELTIDSNGNGVSVVGPTAAASDFAVDPENNLVTKALRLAGVDAAVSLTKNIPAGAGLGGGSADAAAVLRWAGFTDVKAAATIGADVAFCLLGGRARVEGIGEIVTPLDFEPATYTLVTPPVHCSTPAVYAQWDEMGGPRGERKNDLEPAALRVAPELVTYREALGEATGEEPQLAGSGSSWFVRGAFPEAGLVVNACPADLEIHNEFG
jgi:4-diphosphocytidyl-2-C-methyl-D-erythritol kinase